LRLRIKWGKQGQSVNQPFSPKICRRRRVSGIDNDHQSRTVRPRGDPTHERYLLSDLISPIVSSIICGVQPGQLPSAFDRASLFGPPRRNFSCSEPVVLCSWWDTTHILYRLDKDNSERHLPDFGGSVIIYVPSVQEMAPAQEPGKGQEDGEMGDIRGRMCLRQAPRKARKDIA